MAGSRLLTIADVIERTALARTTVYKLIREEQLPSVTIGRARRVREEDLDAFIEGLLASTGTSS